MANKNDLFRTDVIRAGGVRVERKKEIIRGFAVVTKGTTHDERGEFDDIALDKIIELGNKSKTGIKSRFGHPNMSNTALGTFLGRVKGFKRDNDIVRADLYIDQTAHKTPDGDLASYVMDLAESDPNAFGSSMVIHWDEEQRIGEDGNTIKDENDKVLPPLIRVRKLNSVDIVDDPAANNGLFGEPFFSDSVMLSAEMTAFLDRFLTAPDAIEKVIGFLDRYRANQSESQNQKKEEVNKMFENLTIDELKKEKPDLFEEIRKLGLEEGLKTGKEEGQKLERERAVSILKEAANFKDMHELASEAVEKGFNLDQAVITFQKRQLEGLKTASPDGPGPDNDDEKGTKKKSHLERAKAYKEEHNCTMTEALQATAEKRAK